LRRFGYFLLVFAVNACSSRPTLSEQSPPASSSIVEPEDLFKRYTYFELFAAGELLDQLAQPPIQAEAERAMGCRILPDTARDWSRILKTKIERSADTERLAYQENPIKYQRSRGFDQCVPNCVCVALSAILKQVSVNFFQGPELRAAHRGYLRKLEIKTLRQSSQGLRSCIERQTWFCESDLREYLAKSTVE